MIKDEVVMIVTSDISGQLRGKGFPLANIEKRLKRGVGWVPTNVQITCFNTIADSPYGSTGDLILVPDSAAEVKVDFDDGGPLEHFFIGNIRHLDGTPWECCTRSLAQKALDDLQREAGLQFYASFEHEFFYSGAATNSWSGFSLDGYRKNADFAETFVAALEKAGVQRDTFLPEYGPGQFEATISPSVAIRAADQSIILREMAHATAARLNQWVSFSPVVTPESVGNGVHIHFSLLDEYGSPAAYDPDHDLGLSETARRFCAGVLKYMPYIVALTAPSVISYQRLTPHKWSAAFNNLAVMDREAGLRICPVVKTAEMAGSAASQFNLEYRAADAAASPYLQIAALVRAGLQGIKDSLPSPEVTREDLSLLSGEQLASMGVERLPDSLDRALERFADEPVIREWFSSNFVEIYLKHKQQEISDAKDIGEKNLFERYSAIY